MKVRRDHIYKRARSKEKNSSKQLIPDNVQVLEYNLFDKKARKITILIVYNNYYYFMRSTAASKFRKHIQTYKYQTDYVKTDRDLTPQIYQKHEYRNQ